MCRPILVCCVMNSPLIILLLLYVSLCMQSVTTLCTYLCACSLLLLYISLCMQSVTALCTYYCACSLLLLYVRISVHAVGLAASAE